MSYADKINTSGYYGKQMASLHAQAAKEGVKLPTLEAEITRLRGVLVKIATEEFDDLDPDDGLHANSARRLAREALGGEL